MTTQEPMKKVQRDPVVMFLSGVVWLIGLMITVLGLSLFSVDSWLWSVLVVLSGLSSSIFASMTIVTGNRAWLLLDLILPN